ncbi:MAG: zinc ribbon domain-containing protein [Acidimicrobiales bacterium]
MTKAGTGKGKRGKAGLNRAILDASPAELHRQLAYKTIWFGSTLFVADRWYPSSKTCSACKAVKAKLPLACRCYRCDHCGLVIDRDRNAASNLASLAGTIATTGTASGAGTSQHRLANGRGEERSMGTPRCSSPNRQDGTSPTRPDKTVAATRQQVAPNPVLVGSDR